MTARTLDFITSYISGTLTITCELRHMTSEETSYDTSTLIPNGGLCGNNADVDSIISHHEVIVPLFSTFAKEVKTPLSRCW